jgi:hypothetical protein
MPLCGICSSAAVKLHSSYHPYRKSEPFETTFPRLGSAAPRNCWACLKFSKWLEAEHLDLFRTWQTEEICVIYSMHLWARMDHPNGGYSYEFLLDLRVHGLNPRDACFIDVNAVPVEGI